jgi:glycosyltransferase involved in cell wall biosynthesis
VNKNKARNVVYVHDSHGYGGMELYILRLIRHLDRERFSPAVLIPGSDLPFRSSSSRFIQDLQSEEIPILRPPDPGRSRLAGSVREITGTAALLKRHKTDIVHIHTCRSEGARKATLAARMAGVRGVIRSEHFPPSANYRPAARYLIKPFDWLTDAIVTGSMGDRQGQIDLLKRDPRKVFLTYNSIELDMFSLDHNPEEAKESLGLDPSLPVIGNVGRLAPEKGHVYLLEAHAEVVRRVGPVVLLLVGDGELLSELQEQAQRLGTADFVQFAGFQADVLPYMQAADIAAMPSLFEVFSLAMLEFMALGKPVVASDHSSFLEAINDGVSGLIVPVKDSRMLAQALLRLLEDDALRREMGMAGLRSVRAQFSFKRLANDIMGYYEKILNHDQISSPLPHHS